MVGWPLTMWKPFFRTLANHNYSNLSKKDFFKITLNIFKLTLSSNDANQLLIIFCRCTRSTIFTLDEYLINFFGSVQDPPILNCWIFNWICLQVYKINNFKTCWIFFFSLHVVPSSAFNHLINFEWNRTVLSHTP